MITSVFEAPMSFARRLIASAIAAGTFTFMSLLEAGTRRLRSVIRRFERVAASIVPSECSLRRSVTRNRDSFKSVVHSIMAEDPEKPAVGPTQRASDADKAAADADEDDLLLLAGGFAILRSVFHRRPTPPRGRSQS